MRRNGGPLDPDRDHAPQPAGTGGSTRGSLDEEEDRGTRLGPDERNDAAGWTLLGLALVGLALLAATAAAAAGPTASFSVDPAEPEPGETIAFTDESEGNITDWQWSFGDGNGSSEQNTSHAYDEVGSYNVTLTVTNETGETDEATQQLTVEDPGPVADFTLTPTTPEVDETVTFENTSQGQGLTHNWTFGDGNTSTEENATHAYASAGTYEVTLTVEDADGDTDEATQQLTVEAAAPVADFGASCSGLNCSFDASASTGTIETFAWDFGDDQGQQGPDLETINHTFPEAGNYTVSLTVEDGDGRQDQAQHEVHVEPPAEVEARFSVDTDGLEISVDASESQARETSIEQYVWRWSQDGPTDTTTEPQTTHTYDEEGSYAVNLTIETSAGLEDTTGRTVEVSTNEGPEASFEVNVEEGTIRVDASGTQDPDGSIRSYIWEWGDGTESQGETSQHTYETGGEYRITLRAYDDEGALGRAGNMVTVEPPEPEGPTADFEADWSPDGDGYLVELDAGPSQAPESSIDAYRWSIRTHDGSNASETGETASHPVPDPGNYEVTLAVSDADGRTDRTTREVTVNRPPQADLDVTTEALQATVSANGSDPDGEVADYVIDWGDGTTSSGPDAEHTYAEDGSYEITLTVEDHLGGTGEVTETVSVEFEWPEPEDELAAQAQEILKSNPELISRAQRIEDIADTLQGYTETALSIIDPITDIKQKLENECWSRIDVCAWDLVERFSRQTAMAFEQLERIQSRIQGIDQQLTDLRSSSSDVQEAANAFRLEASRENLEQMKRTFRSTERVYRQAAGDLLDVADRLDTGADRMQGLEDGLRQAGQEADDEYMLVGGIAKSFLNNIADGVSGGEDRLRDTSSSFEEKGSAIEDDAEAMAEIQSVEQAESSGGGLAAMPSVPIGLGLGAVAMAASGYVLVRDDEDDQETEATAPEDEAGPEPASRDEAADPSRDEPSEGETWIAENGNRPGDEPLAGSADHASGSEAGDPTASEPASREPTSAERTQQASASAAAGSAQRSPGDPSVPQEFLCRDCWSTFPRSDMPAGGLCPVCERPNTVPWAEASPAEERSSGSPEVQSARTASSQPRPSQRPDPQPAPAGGGAQPTANRRAAAHREAKGSIVGAVFWMSFLSFLLGWIPLVGTFVAGYVGGKKAGSAGRAALVALLPAIVVGALLFAAFEAMMGIPLIGLLLGIIPGGAALVGAGAFVFVAAMGLPLLLGALLGGSAA